MAGAKAYIRKSMENRVIIELSLSLTKIYLYVGQKDSTTRYG